MHPRHALQQASAGAAAKTAVALVLMLCVADAYPRFVARIPNADAIAGVQSIGHRNAAGGGALNVFGEAFRAQNSQWTLALCHADSDGDGATNGEELGDPCCKWSASGSSTQLVRTGSHVSHPGVANTWTSQQLQTLACHEGALNSDATGAEGTTAVASGVATFAPVATVAPDIVRSDATARGVAAASGHRAGSSGNDALSTIDPVGLTEIPPSLVPESPETPSPQVKPAPAPVSLPLPASTASEASSRCVFAGGVAVFSVAIVAGVSAALATASVA